MARERLTLATMCDGAVQERIERALEKVSENILDPNTDPDKKRSITVTLTMKPNKDDREDITVDAAVSMKLAPDTGIKTQLFISKDLGSGGINIVEHARGEIKGQLNFNDLNPPISQGPAERPVTAEELGCDPDTGEVLEESGGSSKVMDFRKIGNA